MSEIWAIAKDERICGETNASTHHGAWHSLWSLVESKRSLVAFIKESKRRGYSAVRLRYEIVERDGEVR